MAVTAFASVYAHFAYSVILPVDPLAICVTGVVKPESLYQPANTLSVRDSAAVGLASVIVSVVTVYAAGLDVLFVPLSSSYVIVYDVAVHFAYSVRLPVVLAVICVTAVVNALSLY